MTTEIKCMLSDYKIDEDLENNDTKDISNTVQEAKLETEICNKDVTYEKTESVAEDTYKLMSDAVPQNTKRTSKRRPTNSNKSIIQNAIARKEKSFEGYHQPKSRSKRQVKNRDVQVNKNEESTNSQNSILKKSLQNSPKSQNYNRKVKRRKSVTDKSDLEVNSLSQVSQELVPNLRRSQRSFSSENKGETSSPDTANDEECLVKAQLNLRLCKCTENKGLFMETDAESQFCTAVDSISEKLIGCSRLVDVKTVPMHRPSTRIPFGVFCDAHIQRLIRHNCCPTCGVFCTQGQFAECPSKHHFHKDCKLFVENLACCPHCGDSTKSTGILISMYSSKKPVFLPVQRSHQLLMKIIKSSNKTTNVSTSCERLTSCLKKEPVPISFLIGRPSSFYCHHLTETDKTYGKISYVERAIIRHESSESRYCLAVSFTGPIVKCLTLPSTSAKMSFKTIKEVSEYCNVERSNSPPIINSEQLQLLRNQVTNFVDNCNEDNLAEAIENEDIGTVAAILSNQTIDLNTRLEECNKGSFLHLAILKGSVEIVFLLVSASINLDLLDKEQNSPLMLAVSAHESVIARYLIKAGAEVTVKGTDGMTALHIAAKCGNLQACEILLTSSFGISNFVNWQDDGGWTPLVWACEHGYIDVAKYLVSKGADVNIRDVEHNVALHWAAFSGSSQIVELLLNWKCDINVVNVHSDTPLHISAREDRYNCAIILLGRNANISLINKNNETPLDCAPKDGLCFNLLALNVQLCCTASEHQHILTNDISRGRELNPIQCCNRVDSESEPNNYTYIKTNCITSDDIQINRKVSTIQCCSCEDRCMSSNCACGQLSLRCWYDVEGKLLPEFNFCDPPLIFECNELCSCNSILCMNRLVQKPLTQRFQLFRTNSKGWGIRTLNSIAKGNYVCEYVGEILTDTEADHREDDSYLFDLDNRETDSFCIDAKYYGNFARFINHSCDPNLYPVKVFVDHHDLRFPRIALFAKTDIGSDEELSFDYGEKFWLVKYKSFTCDCGANICKYSEETIGSTLEKYQMM